MIEADQPYCADVDECSDERDQFNKLHVGGHQTINTSLIFSLGLLSLVVIIAAPMFAGVRRLHQLHQLGRLLQLRVPAGLPQLGGEPRLLGHRRVRSATTMEQAAMMFIW